MCFAALLIGNRRYLAVMNHLNINISKTINSEEFSDSDPVNRATWLCLLAYCAEQENGGVIKDAKSRTDRAWQQLCRITLKELSRKSKLWHWDGDDLVVLHYPKHVEEFAKERRRSGQKGGIKSGIVRREKGDCETSETEAYNEIALSSASSNAEANIMKPNVIEPNVKKGKKTAFDYCPSRISDDLFSQAFAFIHSYWNRAVSRSGIKQISEPSLWVDRRKHDVGLFLGMPDKVEFEALTDRVLKSDFLCGGNKRKWVVFFDWVIKPENVRKIMSGEYDNAPSSNKLKEFNYQDGKF